MNEVFLPDPKLSLRVARLLGWRPIGKPQQTMAGNVFCQQYERRLCEEDQDSSSQFTRLEVGYAYYQQSSGEILHLMHIPDYAGDPQACEEVYGWIEEEGLTWEMYRMRSDVGCRKYLFILYEWKAGDPEGPAADPRSLAASATSEFRHEVVCRAVMELVGKRDARKTSDPRSLVEALT